MVAWRGKGRAAIATRRVATGTQPARRVPRGAARRGTVFTRVEPSMPPPVRLKDDNMHMHMTKSSEVIDALNDLIEICKDGEYGFRSSAEQAKSTSLRANLSARSSECATAADQLRSHVVQLGGKPAESGSAIGAMHRGWVAVKATL